MCSPCTPLSAFSTGRYQLRCDSLFMPVDVLFDDYI